MKKYLILMLALFAGGLAQAQELKFGIKLGVGLSSASLKEAVQSISLDNPSIGRVNFKEGGASTSFHVGATSRIGVLGFFIMPELYYSSVTNEVVFEEVAIGSSTATVIRDLNETVSRLDLPVLVGFRVAKKIRLNAGPVASLVVSRKSGIKGQLEELLGAGSFDEASDNFTFGFQAGAGIDISSLSIDLRYEGNLSWLGSDINIGPNDLNFDSRVSQVMLSLGLML